MPRSLFVNVKDDRGAMPCNLVNESRGIAFALDHIMKTVSRMAR